VREVWARRKRKEGHETFTQAKESLAAAIATGKGSELNVSDELYIPLEEREHLSRSQQRRVGFRYSSEEESAPDEVIRPKLIQTDSWPP